MSCQRCTPEVTPCVCPPDDFTGCVRHKCEKNPHLKKLCRTRLDYFQLWESGRGPCLNSGDVDLPRHWPGLGDCVAMAIKFVTFGRVRPCTTCQSRAAKLNRLGWRIAAWWRGLGKAAR